MAVSKIRKLSSTTLLVLSAISVAIFILFFVGGYEIDAKGNKDYSFTGLLLYWSYFLSCATIVVTLCFALRGLFTKSSSDLPAKRSGLIAGCVLIGSLILGYVCSDGEPIKALNEASQAYNTSGWLKVTDMWLYSTYVLFFATIAAVVWGGISSRLLKK